LSLSHVVYGLVLGTNSPIPGLRVLSDPAQPDVQIRLKDRSTPLSPNVASLAETLYPIAGGTLGTPNLRFGVTTDEKFFAFHYSDGARFAVERKGREVWGDWSENYTLEDACTYLLGPVLAFVLRLRGVISLHASAVVVGNLAVALAGCPGAGKSTTAAAFARCGFPALADDVVALAGREEGFLVQPGYPRLNLWPDAVRALFGSDETSPSITPTWNKRYMPLDENGHRFASGALPLGAIYVLESREPALTDAALDDLSGAQAVALLAANTQVNYLLDRHMRQEEFDVLSRLVARIPIRTVRCPSDTSALTRICQTIAADAERLFAGRACGSAAAFR
jgi:hypothetical protein